MNELKKKREDINAAKYSSRPKVPASELSLIECTSIVNEPAFERLEAAILSFCLTQIIK